jgi:DNA helicase-2/ATP-dependent DNA helicase PcrA
MSGFRIARLLPGVGPATAGKLLDAMESAPDPVIAMGDFRMAGAAAGDFDALRDLFGVLRSSKASWPADIDAATRWYEPHLRRIYDDAHIRQADLIQLGRIASTYASRERFLTEVTLDPPAATSDEAGAPGLDDDYLILSTIHSAKGQEWRSVHVLNVVDGCIPSDLSTGSAEEIEEERRLLYVAMTRARDELRLMVPQRFYVHQQTQYGDRHVYASRSRFIPNGLISLFESCAWPPPEANAQTHISRSTPMPVIDIASRARLRWQQAG